MKKQVRNLIIYSLVPLSFSYVSPQVTLAADNSTEINNSSMEKSLQDLSPFINIDLQNSNNISNSKTEILTLSGKTIPGYKVVLQSPNFNSDSIADADGNFYIDVPSSITEVEINLSVFDNDILEYENMITLEEFIPESITDIENNNHLSAETGTTNSFVTSVSEESSSDNKNTIDDMHDVEDVDTSEVNEGSDDKISTEFSSSANESSKAQTFTITNQNPGKTSYIINDRDFKNIKKGEDIIDSVSKRLNNELNKKVSKKQIINWNNITDSNSLKVGDVLFIDGSRPVNFANNSNKPFKNSSDFLNYIAPHAKKLAAENNIYASVMIAQAIKETGWGTSDISQPPFHNLFGIKADANDDYSVIKETWEVVDGKNIQALAPFKVFDNYYDGFIENKNKIKNGVSWDPVRYSGAWMENATYYSNATESLTGRYAMDPNYHHGLNALIETYKLTNYDTHKTSSVISQKSVYYDTKITKSGFTIDSNPYRTHGFKTLDYSGNYLNRNVTVTNEAITNHGTYFFITLDGVELGWIDKDATTGYLKTLETRSVAYEAIFNGKNHNLFSQPVGMKDSKRTGYSSNYKGKKVHVYSEKVTDNGTFALVTLNGNNLGWINTEGITTLYDKVNNTQAVSYKSSVKGNGHNIFSKPAWTKSSVKIADSVDYKDMEFTIYAEKLTDRGTYAELKQNGNTLGWMNTKGLNLLYTPILETKGVSYNASIRGNGHNIYSAPAWTENNIRVANTKDFRGNTFTVYTEKVTKNGTYAQVKIGDNTVGWVDVKGISPQYLPIKKEQAVSYNATIIGNGHNIFSAPAWTEDSHRVAEASDFKGSEVTVYIENITSEGTYAQLKQNGVTLGWMNTKGLAPLYSPVFESRGVSYNASIRGNGHNIYTTPAWTKGNIKVANTKDYRGETFTVYSERVTKNGTYAQVKLGDNTVGWVDIKGISPQYLPIKEQRTVSYNATIRANGHNIFSAPAWTKDSHKVAEASDFKDSEVTIYIENITSEGTYAQLKHNGRTLGWMNTKGLSKKFLPVLETNTVSYQAKIVGNGHNIFSTPAWTKDSIKIADSSDYAGTAITIREEKITPDGRYFLATKNKKVIGWIFYKGVYLNRPLVYIDAGHGGTESGAASGGVLEKDLNLSVAKEVERLLLAKDYNVVMSRTSDSTLSLSHRAQEANQLQADIFVSIHQNAFNGNVAGIETYYYNGRGNTNNPMAKNSGRISDSKKLAEEIHKELVSKTGAADRGVRRENFHVIRETKMPAVLVESGYMDNPAERAKLVLKSYQQKIAQAVANGVDRFFKLFK